MTKSPCPKQTCSGATTHLEAEHLLVGQGGVVAFCDRRDVAGLDATATDVATGSGAHKRHGWTGEAGGAAVKAREGEAAKGAQGGRLAPSTSKERSKSHCVACEHCVCLLVESEASGGGGQQGIKDFRVNYALTLEDQLFMRMVCAGGGYPVYLGWFPTPRAHMSASSCLGLRISHALTERTATTSHRSYSEEAAQTQHKRGELLAVCVAEGAMGPGVP
jgi:hypothetical protein